jgi:O-antigen/teichoic acid export membrane protein
VALTSFVSYLTLLDLGGQNYIGNLLAREHASGDEAGFRQRLSEGVSLFLAIAVAALAVLGGVLLWLPASAMPAGLREPDSKWILLLMSSAFLISVPAGVYVTAYRASGLFVRGTMLGNASRLVGLGMSVLLLALKLRPLHFAIGYLAICLAGTAVIVRDSRTVIAACRSVSISVAATRAGSRHLGGAFYFWLMALAQALNLNGVVVVIAALASPVLVATYVTHRTIAGLVSYPGALLQAPLWPELTFLSAQQRTADLRQLALVLVTVVTIVAGIVAVGLWVLGPQIYALWTRKALVVDGPLLLLFLAQGVLAAAWSTSGWTLLASNRHQSLAVSFLVNGVLTVVLCVFLLPMWGLRGAAAASLLADLVCGVAVVPVLAARLLAVSPLRLYAAGARGLAALAPLALVAWALTRMPGTATSAVFLLAAIAWTVATVGYFLRDPNIARFGRLVVPGVSR